MAERADPCASSAIDLPVVRSYDVDRLTWYDEFDMKIPPGVELVSPDDVADEDNPLFGAGNGEPPPCWRAAEDMIEFVKSEVCPTYWKSQGEITARGYDVIRIKATPGVHQEVAVLIDGLQKLHD